MSPVIPATDPAVRPAHAPAQMLRGPLPLPERHPVAVAAQVMYVLSAVDRSGRIADRSIVRTLRWVPGELLDVGEHRGIVTVRAVTGRRGPVGTCGRVDGRGFLHLPPTVRRRCGLTAGDRLLLAADPDAGQLTGYPLPTLGLLLAAAPPGTTRAGGTA